MVAHHMGIDAVDVPSHIQEEFQVVSSHLRIMHIDYPYFANVMVVCLLHFLVDQTRLHRGQPKMVVRSSPITQVVVDATTALAFLFLCIRQTSEIAVVVITPHQRHIIWHFQASIIDGEHFLVRYEDLCLLGRVADMLAYQLLLVVDDLLQTVKLLLHGLHAFHRTIMDASHTDSQHVTTLGILHLVQSSSPVLLYLIFIDDVVVTSLLLHIPFIKVVSQQRFAVGTADGNATAIRHRLGTRDFEECGSTLMHRRPNGIGTESHQELEHLFISITLEVVAPRTNTPILIIDEDTTIFHRCPLQSGESLIEHQAVLLLRYDVSPPYPRIHTCLS